MATKKGNSKSPRSNSKKSTKKDTEIVVVQEERQEMENFVDPRQALFLQLYYDKESPTWGNAKQSAISAGFDYDYSCQITYRKPKWWLDFVRQENLVDLIEQHFTEVLTMPSVTQAMGPFGPIEKTETVIENTGEIYKSGKRKGQPVTRKKKIKVPVLVRDVSIIKEKTAVAKIAAPAHDPDRYGRKAGGTNNFIFNMAGDRQKYAWNTGNS